MRALSIKEPWASMILKGKKTIETRTWTTQFRGRILLCASKLPETLLSGCAFATAELKDIRLMVKEDESLACCEIYPGAFSWVLEDVKPIKPFYVKGQLGIFEVKISEVNYEGELKNDK